MLTPVDSPGKNASHTSIPSTPSFALSIFLLGAIVSVISIGLLIFHAELHLLMCIALFIAAATALFACVTGQTIAGIGRYDESSLLSGNAKEIRKTHSKIPPSTRMRTDTFAEESFCRPRPFTLARDLLHAIGYTIWRAKDALIIFILIGVLIAALIQSGTVATLIYWGVLLIHPGWFLPAGLLLCSLMSIATGTAWGTVGTAGVVLMGIGSAMDIPLPLVAGMVVCGATFGDKMSPISDTTNLAAMAARTDLYHHIRSMTYTTAPAYLITLLAFALVGRQYTGYELPEDKLLAMESAITSAYQIGWWTMAPLIVLILMSILRIGAITTMLTASIVAVLVALGMQSGDAASILAALWHGDSVHTPIDSLTSLFSRGGIVSMWFTVLLSLQALALGGVLTDYGFMRAILAGLLTRVKRIGSLVTSTIICALVGNLGMGEAYLSIVLGGQLFSDAYDDADIDRGVLSRCLEEGATLTTPLIPWTTAGVFFSQTLEISTLEYLPFAWMNLLNPLMGIAFAYLGWGLMLRKTVRENPTPK
ncbi:MAG: Na+/H+ antiporter NhaC [Actinomycetaceae bacterium]|nr:Na+/H+ antiporter NhaC [Actinomycetaceae bacterium]